MDLASPSNNIFVIENPNDVTFTWSYIETNYNLSLGVSDHIQSDVIIPLAIESTIVPSSCFNTNDGQAWIQWPGADPLFNYSWQTDPIGTVLDTGVETSILLPGNYNLVVHYADSASFGQNYVGCDLVQPFTIGGPIALTSGAVIVNENCFDADDGSISLSPNSDASPYTVVWDTTTSIPIYSRPRTCFCGFSHRRINRVISLPSFVSHRGLSDANHRLSLSKIRTAARSRTSSLPLVPQLPPPNDLC